MAVQINKEEGIVMGALALIAIVIIVWLSLPQKDTDVQFLSKTDETASGTATTLNTPTTTSTTTPKATTKTVPKTVTTPSIKAGESYSEALKTYANWRFQFVKCRATPGTFIIKKGQKFMLDNRDAQAHTIKVGSVSYKIASYGWKAVTASVAGNIPITCDGGGSAVVKVLP